MKSRTPPPPPPYASKHTIIAAPPAVSARTPSSAGTPTSPFPPTVSSPLFNATTTTTVSRAETPHFSASSGFGGGQPRVSSALNITFQTPPSSPPLHVEANTRNDKNTTTNLQGFFDQTTPRRHAVQKVGNPLNGSVDCTPSNSATIGSSSGTTDWKPGMH